MSADARRIVQPCSSFFWRMVSSSTTAIKVAFAGVFSSLGSAQSRKASALPSDWNTKAMFA